MKGLFNLRYPVLLAIALIIGVLTGYLFVYHGINFVYLFAIIPFTAVIFIICFCCIKKNAVLTMIVLLCFFLLAGAVSCFLRLQNYEEKLFVDGETYNITATVYEKGETAYGKYLILSNATCNGIKINGKIYAYLSDAYGDFCDIGYQVKFSSVVTSYETFSNGALQYNIQKNIKYRCSVNGDLTAKYGFSFFGWFRSRIRSTVYSYLDTDTAAIVFAMLTGNTQGVENGALQSFRYGGIAHIFAVSGLHIGIIYGIVQFICKKAKIHPILSAILCIFIIFFYAGICGFSLSSMRAAIMCTVSALSRLIHKKYDPLNALAVSILLILLIQPISLFSIGFQLSVCAVGSIFMLFHRIEHILQKIKIPHKLSSAVGVSVSAQIGVLPVMLANFGYISGAGLLLNIVFIPILSFLFIILFLCMLICSVLPFVAGFLLPVAALPLEALISFIIGIGFEKAIISGFGSGAFVLLYFLFLPSFSDKINLKKNLRIPLNALSVAVLIACFLLN